MKLFRTATLVVSGAFLALGAVAARADQEATCPVSGHKVTVTDKTPSLTVNGQKQYFCCSDCPAAFVKNPSKFVKADLTCPVMTSNKANMAKAPVLINDQMLFTCCGGCPSQIVSNPEKYIKETRDPVSGETFKLTANLPHSEYKGVHYLFSNEDNKKAFDADPGKYANKLLSKDS